MNPIKKEYDHYQTVKRWITKPINLLLVALALFVIIIALLSIPHLLAVSYRFQSEYLYQQALISENKSPVPGFSCSIPTANLPQARSILERAMRYLDTSINLNQNSARAVLMKGRIFCLLGNSNEAIQSFFIYTQSRSEDPIGDLELITSIESYWNLKSDQPIDRSALPTKDTNQSNEELLFDFYRKSWKKLGISPLQLLKRADQQFDKQNYPEAESSYRRATQLGMILNESEIFKWNIASTLTGNLLGKYVSENFMSNIHLHDGLSRIQISGDDFIWIGPDKPKVDFYVGRKLPEIQNQDPDAGVIWWVGNAGVLIDIPDNNFYRITIRAKHIVETQGKNGEIRLFDNMSTISNYVLTEDWQEFQSCIQLDAGIHLIGIEYINDIGNTVIDWARFDPVPGC